MIDPYVVVLERAAAEDTAAYKHQDFCRITGADEEGHPIIVFSVGDVRPFSQDLARVARFVLLMLDGVTNHQYVVVYFDSSDDGAPSLSALRSVCPVVLPPKYEDNLHRIFIVNATLNHKLWLTSRVFTGGAGLVQKVSYVDLEELFVQIDRRQIAVPSSVAERQVKSRSGEARQPAAEEVKAVNSSEAVAAPRERSAGSDTAPINISFKQQQQLARNITRDGNIFGVSLKRLQHRSIPPQNVPSIVMDCIALIEEALLEGFRTRNLFRDYSAEMSDKVTALSVEYDSAPHVMASHVDLTSRGCDIMTASMLLVTYLHLLPEPLIPLDLQECMMGAQGIEDFGVRVACLTPLLMSLQTANLKFLQELLPFLNCLALLDSETPAFDFGLQLPELGNIFAPLIFGESATRSALSESCGASDLVVTLIQAHDEMLNDDD